MAAALDPLSLFLTGLGKAAGKAAAAQGTQVLRELVGLQAEQARLLATIDIKLDALIASPFGTGRLQLERALAEWREPDDRQRLMQEAMSSFMTALAQDTVPLRRSFAALHLAAVSLALDQPRDVRRDLKTAHTEALRAGRRAVLDGMQGTWRDFFDYSKAFPRGIARSAPIVRYANDLASARYEWEGGRLGATSIPVFAPVDSPRSITELINWVDQYERDIAR